MHPAGNCNPLRNTRPATTLPYIHPRLVVCSDAKRHASTCLPHPHPVDLHRCGRRYAEWNRSKIRSESQRLAGSQPGCNGIHIKHRNCAYHPHNAHQHAYRGSDTRPAPFHPGGLLAFRRRRIVVFCCAHQLHRRHTREPDRTNFTAGCQRRSHCDSDCNGHAGYPPARKFHRAGDAFSSSHPNRSRTPSVSCLRSENPAHGFPLRAGYFGKRAGECGLVGNDSPSQRAGRSQNRRNCP